MGNTSIDRLYRAESKENRNKHLLSLAPRSSYGPIRLRQHATQQVGGRYGGEIKTGVSFTQNGQLHCGNVQFDYIGRAVWHLVKEQGKWTRTGSFSGSIAFNQNEFSPTYRKVLESHGLDIEKKDSDIHKTILTLKPIRLSNAGSLFQMQTHMQPIFSRFEELLDLLNFVGGIGGSRYETVMKEAISRYETFGVAAGTIGLINGIPTRKAPEVTVYGGHLHILEGSLTPHVRIVDQIVRPTILFRNTTEIRDLPPVTLDVIIDSIHPFAGAADLLLTNEIEIALTEQGYQVETFARRDGRFRVPVKSLHEIPNIVESILADQSKPELAIIEQVINYKPEEVAETLPDAEGANGGVPTSGEQ